MELVKSGSKIYRECWDSKGIYVYYVPSSSYKSCTEITNREFGDLVPYEPYLAIKNIKGTISTWTPSIDDILNEDWEVYV